MFLLKLKVKINGGHEVEIVILKMLSQLLIWEQVVLKFPESIDITH